MVASRQVKFEQLFERAVKNFRYRFERIPLGETRVIISTLDGDEVERIEAATREALVVMMEAKGYQLIPTSVAFELDDAP